MLKFWQHSTICHHADFLCEIPWRHFGEKNTIELLSILEPVGERYVQRINENAGENWMPAARPRRR
jgi:hypothetical protein